MESYMNTTLFYPPYFSSSPYSVYNNIAYDIQASHQQSIEYDNYRRNRNLQEPSWLASKPSQTTRIISSQRLSSLPNVNEPSVYPSMQAKKRIRVNDEPSRFSNDVLASSALASLSLGHPAFTTSSTPLTSSSSTTPDSPLSISDASHSDASLSSSGEMASPSSSALSPTSSPVTKRVPEIRHKGKQLKSRCTCCHVCRTSLKNYPRNHLDCSACNAVVCQPCIEFRLSGSTWEVASQDSQWLCPACLGTCVCPRCTARPLELTTTTTSPTKKRKETESNKKRKQRTPEDIAREQRLEELLENYRQRDKFIHEIQNVLCIVRRDQREIEHQIEALQNRE